MVDVRKIREVVDRAVAEVTEAQMSLMRRQVIERVCNELDESGAHGGSQTDLLHAAVVSLHDATTQGEILRALLDGSAKFCGRVGLLVVRGGMATGWQSRGFGNDDIFKIVSLDCSKGLAARVVQSRIAANGTSADFDPNFLFKFGAPANDNLLLIPLVVRDKVAGLIYADAGTQSTLSMDSSALNLLARYAGLWIEVVAARKSSGASAADTGADFSAMSGAAQYGNGLESPKATAQAVGFAPPSRKTAFAEEHEYAEPEHAPTPIASATVAAIPPPAATPPPPSFIEAAHAAEDDESQKKARRFARLLVDEIQLYNQDKIAEGRLRKDLYHRLREDIEKSRVTYMKRYGQVACAMEFFDGELVRILADNDPTLLGSSFSR